MMRFFLAGLVATSVDFALYNTFLRYVGKNERVLASVFSVTFAMSVSFLLNRFWVFSNLHPEGWPIVAFLAVTFTSAYGIQSIVIYTLSKGFRLRFPERMAQLLGERLRMSPEQTGDLVERNAIKLAAIAMGLVWNFSWYRWYVFV